jgi:predicted 3-demethylubiquinone-9 3-methyltransferase (glyoxalase superfamily)
MKQKITPFLWFDKNCEEAMNFYTSIFKDAKIKSIMRYPEGPLSGPMAGMEGKVRTASFELAGQEFLALDGGPYFKPTGAVSFYIECDGQEEVDYYWDRLIADADPKSQQCGWLLDKYGFSWQVIPNKLIDFLNHPDPVKADKAMAAMMQMKKIIIADLEKAVI